MNGNNEESGLTIINDEYMKISTKNDTIMILVFVRNSAECTN